MSWRTYRVVYQAKSPVHIGWHTLGYINLTRYYIPGRTMWGAFTANAARTWSPPGTGGYGEWGDLFREGVLISYFYPAIDPGHPLLPVYTGSAPMYVPLDSPENGMPQRHFEALFIGSSMQTAIVPDSNTAEENTLHESEFIAPVVKTANGGQAPVYFVGYVFIRDGAFAETRDGKKVVTWEGAEINLADAMTEISVGGDRKYGWGRLALDRAGTCHTDKFFGCDLISDNDDGPVVRIADHRPIPAHMSVNLGLRTKGDIEPLVGMEWDDRGPGQTVKSIEDKLYWMPGSILLEPEAARSTFQVGPYGILNLRGVNVSKSS